MAKLSVLPFAMPNDLLYGYTVLRYFRSHTRLEIELTHTNYTKYLIFEGVEYYSGAMSWIGTSLAISTSEKLLQILRDTERYKEVPDDYLLDQFTLFSSSLADSKTNSQVLILARTIFLLDTIENAKRNSSGVE